MLDTVMVGAITLAAITLGLLVGHRIGYRAGFENGSRRAQATSASICLFAAERSLAGHEKWRGLGQARALARVAGLIDPHLNGAPDPNLTGRGAAI